MPRKDLWVQEFSCLVDSLFDIYNIIIIKYFIWSHNHKQKTTNMNTIILIALCMLGLLYLRGVGRAIQSKQRMINIVFTHAYKQLSSNDFRTRELASRPSLDVAKIFRQIVFWFFYRKTNRFYLEASEEEVLTGVPINFY